MLQPQPPPLVSHPHPQFVAAKSLIVLFLRDFLYTPSYDRLLATVSRFFYLYYFLQKGKVVIKCPHISQVNFSVLKTDRGRRKNA